jgi:hypothetical protein
MFLSTEAQAPKKEETEKKHLEREPAPEPSKQLGNQQHKNAESKFPRRTGSKQLRKKVGVSLRKPDEAKVKW